MSPATQRELQEQGSREGFARGSAPKRAIAFRARAAPPSTAQGQIGLPAIRDCSSLNIERTASRYPTKEKTLRSHGRSSCQFSPQDSVPAGRIYLLLTLWNVPCIGVGTLSWPDSCHREGKLRGRGHEMGLFRDIHHYLHQEAAEKSWPIPEAWPEV